MKHQEEAKPLKREEKMKYMQAQLEINKLQQEVEMLKLDRDYIYHLGHTMIQYSLPSPIYFVFLKRELISLQTYAFTSGAMCSSNTIDQFLALYKCLYEKDKNLLCELYQDDLVVRGYTEQDPNPYLGDVQIRPFASFMSNQIKWNKATSFVEKYEKIEG